jgi:signal peptidase I
MFLRDYNSDQLRMSNSPQQPEEDIVHETTATTTPQEKLKKEKKVEHPLTEIIRFSLIALLIVFPIRMFIAQPFIVSGASMENTFHNGEYLIVDQVTYRFEEPSRGDVVVFRYPRDPSKFFIKRVIGMPGDHIAIAGDVVTITNEMHPTGAVLDEFYIAGMEPSTYLEETLGDGEYFVMGDNRDKSSDSRTWGVLQERNIVGRALFRLFPVNEVGMFPGAHDSEGLLVDTSS